MLPLLHPRHRAVRPHAARGGPTSTRATAPHLLTLERGLTRLRLANAFRGCEMNFRLIVLAAVLVTGASAAAEPDCSQFPLGSLPWTECRYQQLSGPRNPSPPPVQPKHPPVRCETIGAVGSVEWLRCQERLQVEIPPTAKPTHPAYSYTPAPGYYQYTVYSVADPPRDCIIYMRPDPSERYQSSIADWKALPEDRCEHAIWTEPTQRHPDVIFPGGIPWYVSPPGQ